MSDEVTEMTRQYWVDTLLGWAERRLAGPQYDECKRALMQVPATRAQLTAPASAAASRVVELEAELAKAKGEAAQHKQEAYEILIDLRASQRAEDVAKSDKLAAQTRATQAEKELAEMGQAAQMLTREADHWKAERDALRNDNASLLASADADAFVISQAGRDAEKMRKALEATRAYSRGDVGWFLDRDEPYTEDRVMQMTNAALTQPQPGSAGDGAGEEGEMGEPLTELVMMPKHAADLFKVSRQRISKMAMTKHWKTYELAGGKVAYSAIDVWETYRQRGVRAETVRRTGDGGTR